MVTKKLFKPPDWNKHNKDTRILSIPCETSQIVKAELSYDPVAKYVLISQGKLVYCDSKEQQYMFHTLEIIRDNSDILDEKI